MHRVTCAALLLVVMAGCVRGGPAQVSSSVPPTPTTSHAPTIDPTPDVDDPPGPPAVRARPDSLLQFHNGSGPIVGVWMFRVAFEQEFRVHGLYQTYAGDTPAALIVAGEADLGQGCVSVPTDVRSWFTLVGSNSTLAPGTVLRAGTHSFVVVAPSGASFSIAGTERATALTVPGLRSSSNATYTEVRAFTRSDLPHTTSFRATLEPKRPSLLLTGFYWEHTVGAGHVDVESRVETNGTTCDVQRKDMMAHGALVIHSDHPEVGHNIGPVPPGSFVWSGQATSRVPPTPFGPTLLDYAQAGALVLDWPVRA